MSPTGVGRDSIKFKDIEDFFATQNHARLSTIMASSVCLTAFFESDMGETASRMIDFVADLKVKKKHLLVQLFTTLNSSLLLNKTINYEVDISHLDSGRSIIFKTIIFNEKSVFSRR